MLPAHRAIILADPDADKLIIYHNPTGAATFDPSIMTFVSTTVRWETEVGETVTTGTTHNLSYTPTAGPKICKIAVIGGLQNIASVSFGADEITSCPSLKKLVNLLSISVLSNGAYRWFSNEIPPKVNAISANDSLLGGPISALPRGLVSLLVQSGTILSGSISDAPNTLETYYHYLTSGILAGSLAAKLAARDFRLYSNGWNQAGVDTVISSMWGARAAYTYAAPYLHIGGTNAAPSGSYIAPEEGANWHEDSPGHWIPLTGKAMIYDLINDVNGEGFNVWGILFTA